MVTSRPWAFGTFAFCLSLILSSNLLAETVPVRQVEGVTLGFLVLRNSNGQIIANGELKQVVKDRDAGLVISDMQFRFKDGSFYDEITKFTQNGTFRLVSDQVLQKGPSFKHDSESWIDATSGKVTVRTVEKGKQKETTKHLDLPPDVCNGFLNTLLKNVDSNRETTVSMVAASTSPRVVKLNIFPEQARSFSIGLIKHEAQHYRVRVKIEGVAGAIAPLIGKQPADIQVWIVKSEAPTFLEFEGQLSQDTPVWRMQLAAPQVDLTASDTESGKR
jgi:hypothetical protein